MSTIDIATLRMQLRSCGQDTFIGGQRLPGAAALLLNTYDEILNALAEHQGEPDLVVDLPEKPEPPAKLAKYAEPVAVERPDPVKVAKYPAEPLEPVIAADEKQATMDPKPKKARDAEPLI